MNDICLPLCVRMCKCAGPARTAGDSGVPGRLIVISVAISLPIRDVGMTIFLPRGRWSLRDAPGTASGESLCLQNRYDTRHRVPNTIIECLCSLPCDMIHDEMTHCSYTFSDSVPARAIECIFMGKRTSQQPRLHCHSNCPRKIPSCPQAQARARDDLP